MRRFGVKNIIKKGISSRDYRIKQTQDLDKLKNSSIVQIEEASYREEKEEIEQILAQTRSTLPTTQIP